MPETSDRLQRRLVKRLRTHASKILEEITAPLAAPLVVPLGDEDHAVRIEVNPANLAAVAAENLPGRHLGPEEQHVWNVLAGGPMFGWQIAAALKWKYEAKFKHMLSFLEARGVIVNEERVGYSRAPVEG